MKRRSARDKGRAKSTKPKGPSKYAKKKKYLAKHNLWGFEVPEPKPWK